MLRASHICAAVFRRSLSSTVYRLSQHDVSRQKKKRKVRTVDQCQACILRQARGYEACPPSSSGKCQITFSNKIMQKKDPVMTQQGDIEKLNLLLSEKRLPKSPPIPTISLTPGVCSPDKMALKCLHKDQRKFVTTLVKLQKEVEFPRVHSIKEAMERCSKDHMMVTVDDFLHSMVNMLVLVAKLNAKFASQIPGFSNLFAFDKAVLMKAASPEVVAIRSARCYDTETEAIVFANGQPCTLQNMLDTGFGRYADLLFEFCRSMTEDMQTDNVEYALLTTLCFLNSDRAGLADRTAVRALQCRYSAILKAYVLAKAKMPVARLIMFQARMLDLLDIVDEMSILMSDLKTGGSHLIQLVEMASEKPVFEHIDGKKS